MAWERSQAVFLGEGWDISIVRSFFMWLWIYLYLSSDSFQNFHYRRKLWFGSFR